MLNKAQIAAVIKAARSLDVWASEIPVEAFVGTTLSINSIQTATLFPSGDPKGTLALVTSALTNEREKILRIEVSFPTYVVKKTPGGVYQLCGILTHLRAQNVPKVTLDRLECHAAVRELLIRLRQGHHLEAVAGALIQAWTGTASATRRSNDQGIDAHGSMVFVPSELSISIGDSLSPDSVMNNKVFVLASAKAAIGTKSSQRPALLNPAHIRELVGGWVIQRSEVGVWRKNGIRHLTPTQMILATTYRLSEAAKASCFDLGVCIWSIPELTYLICRFAPATVFQGSAATPVSSRAFKAWWRKFDGSRSP